MLSRYNADYHFFSENCMVFTEYLEYPDATPLSCSVESIVFHLDATDLIVATNTIGTPCATCFYS